MKRFLLLFVLLYICMYAHGQVITIVDDQSGKPVELAVLTSEKHTSGEFTNHLGQIKSALFEGEDWIIVRSLGYQSVRVEMDDLPGMNFIIRMKKEDLSLDQVIISASRFNQSSRDVPSKVSTISSKEVALFNPQTLADVLGSSGEVFVQKSQQGGGSPMIRGFATNRLLYAVDGVRMNTAIFRSGNIQNVINLDPFATERVEILFGPGAVIYGSDAIGGVMSFQTLTPDLSLGEVPAVSGKAFMRYSSANKETTGHFDINIGLKKWAFLSSFSSFDYGDLRMGSYGPDEYLLPFYVARIDQTDVAVSNTDQQLQQPTGYSQINFMQKIRFSPNEDWDFQYALHYSATTEYARYDRMIRTQNGAPRYGEWNYGPQRWMMNQLTVQHHGYNKVYDEMVFRAAYQNFEESRMDRNFNATYRNIREEYVDALSLNLDFSRTFSPGDRLFYGVEAIWDDVTSIGQQEDVITGIVTEGPSRYPQATWSSIGAYANYQKRFSKKMLLQTGLRYTRFYQEALFDTTFYAFPFTESTIRNGGLTGSIGTTYTPSDAWTFRVNISSGLRSPNVDDAGKVFDSEPGYVIVPNPDLKAEYAYNAEAGVATIFGKRWKMDLTAYYTRLNDALVRRDYTLNGMDTLLYDGVPSRVQALQNAAKATIYGIQFGLEGEIAEGLSISADVNYQKGEEELDDGTISPSRHAAPFFGMARLSYRSGALQLMLYSAFSAQRSYADMPEEEKVKTEIYAMDENGNPYSPGWATINFKVNYDFESNFTIGAGLENITDLRYRPYSSGIVAPGRNFILSLQARF